MNIRYRIGKLFQHLGYAVKPAWKISEGSMHPLDLAGAVIRAKNAGKIKSIVQIGAFDGIQDDPLFAKLLNAAVDVTMVEPQPLAAATLRHRFQDNPGIRIIEAAVTDQPGEVFLFSESENSPRASLLREHSQRFGQKAAARAIRVKAITPAALFAAIGGRSPDILQIDTEGMDWIILQSLLAINCRPSVINFENFHLGRLERLASRSGLTDCGYRYIEYGWDTCAVSGSLDI